MAITCIFGEFHSHALAIALTACGVWFLFFLKEFLFSGQNKNINYLPPVPAIPGLPFIGNLLQLKEKKPYNTFTKWAESYGPIYSIKLGASIVVVINSSSVAKEAMVTRFSSISTRKLSNALKILSFSKSMVAMSDYDDFHKLAKRYILTSVLGSNAQKRFRHNREIMMENILNFLHAFINRSPLQALNFRKIFESELFRLAMIQSVGWDIDSIYVEDIHAILSRDEIFDILVTDPMEGAIEVDWRDFFPYLWWIPNKRMEEKIHRMNLRRSAVMRALVEQHKERTLSGEKINCYLDFLLSEAKTVSKEQITILTWEAIIETSDTTLVTTEWALYELARDPIRQDLLYQEIKQVCGSDKITEEQLSQLPYLTCVFHETLRKYSPAPVIPLRYVHEDTQLGGFFIPAGTQIAVNIYGCNMEKKKWENPEDWNPERFLDEKYEPLDLHKTMAFGAGKRACAGSLQAMLIFCTVIGLIIQKFQCILGDGEEGNVNTIGLTTRKLQPLMLMLKPR